MDTLWLVFVCVLCAATMPARGSDEHRLVSSLLHHYSSTGGILARPVASFSDTLNVKFGVSLIRADIDETTGLLTAKVWLRYLWNDALLKWDAEQFDGISALHLPIKYMWTPDITLYNSIGPFRNDMDPLSLVYSNSDVLHIPPATLVTQCDKQQNVYDCQLKFGSWTYNGQELDIGFYEGKEDIDLADYASSGVWEVVSSSAKKNTAYYDCCEEPYPDLTFSFQLRKT